MFKFVGTKLEKWLLRVAFIGLIGLAAISTNNQKKLNDKMENIEFILNQQAKNQTVIMDTQCRIIHFVKPHKGELMGCPECKAYVSKWMDELLKAEYTNRDEHSGLELHELPKMVNPNKKGK